MKGEETIYICTVFERLEKILPLPIIGKNAVFVYQFEEDGNEAFVELSATAERWGEIKKQLQAV